MHTAGLSPHAPAYMCDATMPGRQRIAATAATITHPQHAACRTFLVTYVIRGDCASTPTDTGAAARHCNQHRRSSTAQTTLCQCSCAMARVPHCPQASMHCNTSKQSCNLVSLAKDLYQPLPRPTPLRAYASLHRLPHWSKCRVSRAMSVLG